MLVKAAFKVAKVAYGVRGRKSYAAAMFDAGGGAADLDESKNQIGRLAWRDNVGKGFLQPPPKRQHLRLLSPKADATVPPSQNGIGLKRTMDNAAYLDGVGDVAFIRDGAFT